jgi:Uma2 family endonuclease
MPVHQIELPEAKPAYEWVRGRTLQKMSPSRSHGVLQRVFGSILYEWAVGRGWVATEWRFMVTPRDGDPRPLVPDVAYIAAEKLANLSQAEREYPPVAPDIVVEILSPGDRPIDVDHKRDVYLAAGVTLVLIVDPHARTMRASSPSQTERACSTGETYTTPLVPGLTIDLPAIFAQLDTP